MVKYIGKRISHSEKNGELIIVISSKIEGWQQRLIFIWLCAWSFCGVYVFYELFNDHHKDLKLMLMIYLIFWLYFEYKAFYVYLWRKWGVELIKVNSESIQIKNDIRSYGTVRVYDTENIKQLKKSEIKEKSFTKAFGSSFWTLTEKAIYFNYFHKTIAFGIQLNNKESSDVIKLISNHLRKKA